MSEKLKKKIVKENSVAQNFPVKHYEKFRKKVLNFSFDFPNFFRRNVPYDTQTSRETNPVKDLLFG